MTIDDEAADPLPDGGPLQGKQCRAANYEGADVFSSPAPVPTGNTFLGIFDSINAAGTWRLYAMDDAAVDSGVSLNWGFKLTLRPTPYPGTLDVGGLPPISDVNLTLHGFTSTYPDDVDLLLVAPGGQHAEMMSDAGENGDVSSITLTLDDEAAS